MKWIATLLIFANSCFSASWYVTISGLGGDPEYEIRFSGWALDLDKSLKNIPDAQVNTLVGKLATKENESNDLWL